MNEHKVKNWKIGDTVRERYPYWYGGKIKAIGYDCDGEIEAIGFEVKTWFSKKIKWTDPLKVFKVLTTPIE